MKHRSRIEKLEAATAPKEPNLIRMVWADEPQEPGEKRIIMTWGDDEPPSVSYPSPREAGD